MSNYHCTAARFIRLTSAGYVPAIIAADLGGVEVGVNAYSFKDGSSAWLGESGVWLATHEFNGKGAAKTAEVAA